MTTTIRELTPTQQKVLRKIYQLRLLTTTQVCGLAPEIKRRTLTLGLRNMANSGLIVDVTGPPPGRERRWLCTELGRKTAEATREVTPRNYQMTEAGAQAGAHLLGTNEVGFALSRWAEQYGDDISWTPEVAHPYGKNKAAIADAIMHYTLHTREGDVVPLLRFIEYDRGTEAPNILISKLRAYVEVSGYQPPPREGEMHRPKFGWQRDYPSFPHVLFVFGDMTPKAAAGRINYLIGNYSADPFKTDVLTRIPHGETLPFHRRL